MRLKRSLEVDAPPETVWRILADEYAEVGSWACAVHASEADATPPPFPGAAVGGRVCTASIGAVTETIREFDAQAMVLAYEAQAASMPFFVRGLQGRLTLAPSGTGTEVGLRFDADLMAPFETLTGWAMRRQFRTAIDETLEDLKPYAETGRIHPDKARALAA